MDPFLHIYSVASVGRSEAKMVGSDGLDQLSISVQMGKELYFLISVAQLTENVGILVLGCGVGDFTTKQATGFWRASCIHDTSEPSPWLP
jgi:hypothetical protein